MNKDMVMKINLHLIERFNSSPYSVKVDKVAEIEVETQTAKKMIFENPKAGNEYITDFINVTVASKKNRFDMNALIQLDERNQNILINLLLALQDYRKQRNIYFYFLDFN